MTKSLPMTEVAELYATGESLRQLGTCYGVSGDTIGTRLKKAGVKVRSSKEAATMPNARRALSRGRLGITPWNKGKTVADDERIKAYAETLRGRSLSEEAKKKLSLIHTKHKWYATCQTCGRAKGNNRRTMCVFCAAKYRVENYPKMKLLRGLWGGRKTKPERRIHALLDFMFSPWNPYSYTGDRKLWVTLETGRHRNPDFVDLNQKKIIEVFGRYWHKNDDPVKIVREYQEAGWKCLIIWDDEINGSVRDRIMEFTYPYEYEEEIQQCT